MLGHHRRRGWGRTRKLPRNMLPQVHGQSSVDVRFQHLLQSVQAFPTRLQRHGTVK